MKKILLFIGLICLLSVSCSRGEESLNDDMDNNTRTRMDSTGVSIIIDNDGAWADTIDVNTHGNGDDAI